MEFQAPSAVELMHDLWRSGFMSLLPEIGKPLQGHLPVERLSPFSGEAGQADKEALADRGWVRLSAPPHEIALCVFWTAHSSLGVDLQRLYRAVRAFLRSTRT